MDDRETRTAGRLQRPLLVAAVLTIPVSVVQLLPPADPWRTIADVVDWAIWLTFLLEVIVMLVVVRDRRRWLARHPLEIVIVVFTPPLLSVALQSVRVLRLFRLMRLIRLAPLVRRLFSLDGLKYIGLLVLLTLVGGGAAFASSEHVSLGDGLYWAIATMTTGSSGRVTAHTAETKALSVVLVLVGVGFAPLLIGAAAQQFIALNRDHHELEQVELDETQLLEEVRMIAQQLDRIQLHLERGRAGG